MERLVHFTLFIYIHRQARFKFHGEFVFVEGELFPREYRKKTIPFVLLTKINPFDRYFLGMGNFGKNRVL
jgi:hypothetical protein